MNIYGIRIRETYEATYDVRAESEEEARKMLIEDPNLCSMTDHDVISTDIVDCQLTPPPPQTPEMDVGPEVEQLAQKIHVELVTKPTSGMVEWATSAVDTRNMCRQAALVSYQHMKQTGELL